MSWFRRNALRNFETVVKPRLVGKPARYLEIGVWNGNSIVWMLKNVLTHKDALAIGVDAWRPTAEFSKATVDEARAIAEARCKRFGNKVQLTESKSVSWFVMVGCIRTIEQWDCIYIDGDHSPRGVMLDLLLSWPLLKAGGLMILDDYYEIRRGNRGVKPAVDAVLPVAFAGQYNILFSDKYQIGLEKIKE